MTNSNFNAGEERYIGLENFGNTCYCNSVLQALYFCMPLRRELLQWANELQNAEGGPNAAIYQANSMSTRGESVRLLLPWRTTRTLGSSLPHTHARLVPSRNQGA